MSPSKNVPKKPPNAQVHIPVLKIQNPNDFQYIFNISYRLWPIDDQKQFFETLAQLLTRYDALQLRKTLHLHLRKFSFMSRPRQSSVVGGSGPGMLINNRVSFISTDISLFESCVHQRRSTTLEQYDNLLRYFEDCRSSSRVEIESMHFRTIVQNLFPILINDDRWDLITVFNNSLEVHEIETDYANLPDRVLYKIIGKLDDPRDILAMAHTCQNWRHLAGRHKGWVKILTRATKGLSSLQAQLKIWKKNELSIDPQPLRYYNLYLMLEQNATILLKIEQAQAKKRRDLNRLNLRKRKQQQRERRFKKIEDAQRELYDKMLVEMLDEFRTNKKWKEHLMKEYREMYKMGREHHLHRMHSVEFVRKSDACSGQVDGSPLVGPTEADDSFDIPRLFDDAQKYDPDDDMFVPPTNRSTFTRFSKLSTGRTSRRSQMIPLPKRGQSLARQYVIDNLQTETVFMMKSADGNSSTSSDRSSDDELHIFDAEISYDHLLGTPESDSPGRRKQSRNKDLENCQLASMMQEMPVMFVAFFELDVMEFPWLNLHLADKKDWNCSEIQYTNDVVNKGGQRDDAKVRQLSIETNSDWTGHFSKPTVRLPNLRGCQCIRSWHNRTLPTLVIAAGYQRFAVGYRNGSVVLMWAARKPCLHIEKVLTLKSEPGKVSAMQYVGGRFDILLVGTWSTNVVGFGIHSQTELFKLTTHTDTIVSVDHVVTGPSTLVVLSACSGGRVFLHEVEFENGKETSQVKYEIKKLRVLDYYVMKAGVSLKSAQLIDEFGFVTLTTRGVLQAFGILKEPPSKDQVVSSKRCAVRLRPEANLPVYDMVKHVNSSRLAFSATKMQGARVYASLANGQMAIFEAADIMRSLLEHQKHSLDSTTSSLTSTKSARISANTPCKLFPSASSYQASLAFVDSSSPAISRSFTQFKEYDALPTNTDCSSTGPLACRANPTAETDVSPVKSSSVNTPERHDQKEQTNDQRGEINFPVRRTLSGHTEEVVSVAIMSTAFVSLASDGDIQVWFLGN